MARASARHHKNKVLLLRASVEPTSDDVPCFVSFDVTEPCSQLHQRIFTKRPRCYEPGTDSIQGRSVKSAGEASNFRVGLRRRPVRPADTNRFKPQPHF